MTKETHIWRVENEKGAGPYSPARKNITSTLIKFRRQLDDKSEILKLYNDKMPHPTFDQGLIESGYRELSDLKEWSYGFNSVVQYKSWFFESIFRISLDELGFSLVQYEVPVEHAIHGDTQSMFRKEFATVVATCKCIDEQSSPVHVRKQKLSI